MRSLAFISVAFVLLCGCSENDLLVNDNIKYDYSIEQSLFCYCINRGQKVKLFVRADTIADVVLLSDNSHLPYNSWRQYRTIKDLFNEIASHDTSRYIVKVSYDSVFHYPSYLYINPRTIVVNDSVIIEIADADVIYETQNFIESK